MDEILVNTSIVGDQQASAIAGFRGTQYVVVWEDNGDAKIKGQMFAVNGNKTSSEFVVNLPGEPNTSRLLPAVVECGLGFAVAWIEKVHRLLLLVRPRPGRRRHLGQTRPRPLPILPSGGLA